MDEEFDGEVASDKPDFLEQEIMKKKRVHRIGDVINYLGCGSFQVYLFMFCSLLYVVEACELMMLSLLMPTLRKKWDLSPIEETMIGSCVIFGVFFGSFIFGWLSDTIGRRYTIYVAVIATLFFGTVSSFCSIYILFLIVRFIVGICVGSNGVYYSLFLEFLPTRNRGVYLAFLVCSWSAGSVYEAVLGWIVLPNFGPSSWQFYVGFSLFPLVLAIPFLFCVPESIRYYTVRSNERNEVEIQRRIKRTIGRIEKMNCLNVPVNRSLKPSEQILENDDDITKSKTSEIDEEYYGDYEIELVPPTKYKSSFWHELYSNPKLAMMIFNICIFQICGGFCYYSLILTTPDIFDSNEKGMKNKIYVSTFLNALMEIPNALMIIVMVPCFSRKFVQFFFLICGGISLFFLSFPVSSKSYLLLFSLFSRCFLSAGTSVMWILVQESVPTNIRSRGFGFAYAISKFFSAFSPLFAKTIGNHRPVAMMILSILSFVSAFSTCIHPRETKWKHISETFVIQEEDDEVERRNKSRSDISDNDEDEDMNNEGYKSKRSSVIEEAKRQLLDSDVEEECVLPDLSFGESTDEEVQSILDENKDEEDQLLNIENDDDDEKEQLLQ